MSDVHALADLPSGLRDPLLNEYQTIVQNYLERRWSPSELGGGRLCEVVYTILYGHAQGTYPMSPEKPPNMVAACKALEAHTHVPRSFQILVPRLLPALYEIRNNRGVGHVGGDVDSNELDATAVLNISTWIMAELVRVFHRLSIGDAQALVDSLTERRIPLIWENGDIRRVLDTNMTIREQVLVLLTTVPKPTLVSNLYLWIGSRNRSRFNKLLRELHDERQLELGADEASVQILPPGTLAAEKIIAEHRGQGTGRGGRLSS